MSTTHVLRCGVNTHSAFRPISIVADTLVTIVRRVATNPATSPTNNVPEVPLGTFVLKTSLPVLANVSRPLFLSGEAHVFTVSTNPETEVFQTFRGPVMVNQV